MVTVISVQVIYVSVTLPAVHVISINPMVTENLPLPPLKFVHSFLCLRIA
jgi:hypothetical protein